MAAAFNGAARRRAATLPFSFGPFAYGKDRNRPRVRATHSELTFGVLADVPAANASLDQTVQKKKSRTRNTSDQGEESCTR
ncbi:hypothetical protein C8077_05080 [Bifidobacterium adolescentis]|uniref:Uncharacterized protein n=1 Tax=Bifidobacterium adolescentis TaxID=1680 RepID=A0A2R4G3D1_BIFAD|nr:hypothetical protein C8077_05080 [Bifidobacterium adolescentis]